MLAMALSHKERVLAIAYPDNKASIRIMEKIGMQPLGLTNQSYGVECIAYEAKLLSSNGNDTAADG